MEEIGLRTQAPREKEAIQIPSDIAESISDNAGSQSAQVYSHYLARVAFV